MIEKSIPTMAYDDQNDILYVSYVHNAMAYGDEYGGVILLRDMDTDEVTGITILSPKKHRLERELDLKNVALKSGFSFELAQFAF